jgi:hypothetical protein
MHLLLSHGFEYGVLSFARPRRPVQLRGCLTSALLSQKLHSAILSIGLALAILNTHGPLESLRLSSRHQEDLDCLPRAFATRGAAPNHDYLKPGALPPKFFPRMPVYWGRTPKIVTPGVLPHELPLPWPWPSGLNVLCFHCPCNNISAKII